MNKSVKLETQVRLDAYKIISDAIDRAVAYGWSRSHKHSDTPTADHIKQQIHNSIMNELCEIFKFDDNA